MTLRRREPAWPASSSTSCSSPRSSTRRARPCTARCRGSASTASLDVRQGKRFELEVDGEVDRRAARPRCTRSPRRCCPNPVIEDFTVRVDGERRRVRIGVVTFPGSLDDVDAARAVRVAGGEAVAAVARRPRPARRRRGGAAGRLLLRRLPALRRDRAVRAGDDRGDRPRPRAACRCSGICNGFQILCESHLLPGALIRNDHRTFVCRDQRLRVDNASRPGRRRTRPATRS